MRPVSSATVMRFAANAPSLCTCWRIIRRDGVELGLTDHDTDVSFTGTVFHAQGGASGTALEETADLAPDNADILGILRSDWIDAEAIDSGLLDDAVIEVWRVDWEDPSARLLLRSGRIGNIVRQGEGYQAEFRSLKHRLDVVSGRIYGRSCDAALGDGRCGIDLDAAPHLVDGTVVSHSGAEVVISSPVPLDTGQFVGGSLTPLSGPARNRRLTIRQHGRSGQSETVSLWAPLNTPLVVGDAVILRAGCDKRLETCAGRFNNALNFRGFPFIPGSDVLSATPVRSGGSE